MKPNGFLNESLDLFTRVGHGHTAGEIGNVGTETGRSSFNYDSVSHGQDPCRDYRFGGGMSSERPTSMYWPPPVWWQWTAISFWALATMVWRAALLMGRYS